VAIQVDLKRIIKVNLVLFDAFVKKKVIIEKLALCILTEMVFLNGMPAAIPAACCGGFQLVHDLLRLLKKASTVLITQIIKNDCTDISMGFNL